MLDIGRKRDLVLVAKSMAGVLLGDFQSPNSRFSTSKSHFSPKKYW